MDGSLIRFAPSLLLPSCPSSYPTAITQTPYGSWRVRVWTAPPMPNGIVSHDYLAWKLKHAGFWRSPFTVRTFYGLLLIEPSTASAATDIRYDGSDDTIVNVCGSHLLPFELPIPY